MVGHVVVCFALRTGSRTVCWRKHFPGLTFLVTDEPPQGSGPLVRGALACVSRWERTIAIHLIECPLSVPGGWLLEPRRPAERALVAVVTECSATFVGLHRP